HSTPIPAFGGISLFVVFVCAALVMVGIGSSHSIGFVVLSTFILFMSGLKDDLMGTSARTKLLVQIGTAVLVLLNSELTLTHLSGFFGIGEITPILGFLISLGFIVFLVNAYNLIDGIDGLAGSVAIIAFSVFGVYYYVNDYTFLSVIMAAMIGALISFLTWNFASPKRKMFMGDTGSLVIGFILAVNALIIVAGQPVNPDPFFVPQNAVIFTLSILVIPVLDTLRIIVIRLSNGQKPWVADRNHMHHLLLDKGLSHKQATFCLGGLQVIAILGYIGVNNLGPIAQHLFVLCLYSTYAAMFFSASVTRKLGKNGKGFQKLSTVLRTLLP
ncbi:MAG: undecaprenyl/decaprenyl-phosphate alpha-N-acetylglucosaminyl 1-phosphate transferase, partial [Flavobacteriia bacterium]|nr:undecaprenyl/decaprenyl-phosphate alpha-N-acetylglucosaminyl 1-phosphate transferase [Flavobacteriia bacterium]